jgi:membrane protein YqaA with SNARE-associated domain
VVPENIKNSFRRNKEKLIKYGAIVLSILISVCIFYYRNRLADLTAYGYLGIFFINLLGAATIAIPTPALVATFVGGSIYNPLLVGLISGLANTLGELTGYMAGVGTSIILEEDKRFKKVGKWMRINGFITIMILALIPNPLFDLSGIISGATSYSVKKFLLATFIGKTVRFIIIAYIGAYSI